MCIVTTVDEIPRLKHHKAREWVNVLHTGGLMGSFFNLISLLSHGCDVMNEDVRRAMDAILSVAYAAVSVDPSLLCPFSNPTNILLICAILDNFLDYRINSMILRATVILSRLCLHSAGSLPSANIAVTLSKLCDLPIEYFIDENLSDEILASLLAISASIGDSYSLLKSLHPSYFKSLLLLAGDPLNIHRVAIFSRIFPSCLWPKLEKQIEESC